MWSIALYWVEVKKNCSARWTSSASVLHERLQHLGLEAVRQPAGALGVLGLLGSTGRSGATMSWVSWLPPNGCSRM